MGKAMAMAMSVSMVRALGVGINTRSLSTKVSRSHSQSPTIPKEITKAIKPSSSSSEFRKFLGIPGTSRSPNALLISKFLKLYTAQVSLSLFPITNLFPFPFHMHCLPTV
jgi:hypothetical protein